MKAWQLDGLGGRLSLRDIPMSMVRPGSVLVRIEASALMSYDGAVHGTRRQIVWPTSNWRLPPSISNTSSSTGLCGNVGRRPLTRRAPRVSRRNSKSRGSLRFGAAH